MANAGFLIVLSDETQTVKENVLIATWLRDKSKNTQKTYERIVREFFSRYYGLSLKAVLTSHVTAFIFQFREGDSRATQSLYLNCLGSLFTFLQKEGYRDTNPCLPINKIRVGRLESVQIPTPEQIQYLFEKVQDPRNRIILKMLYYTGLRVSELASLRWDQCLNLKSSVKIVVSGKGSKIRNVLVPIALFEELLAAAGDVSGDRKSPYIFKSQFRGTGHISERQVERICSAQAKVANLTLKLHPHILRHAHATHALKNGASLNLVQKNLGHANIQTTAIYLHVDDNDSSGLYL